jgi:hypothetical protein
VLTSCGLAGFDTSTKAKPLPCRTTTVLPESVVAEPRSYADPSSYRFAGLAMLKTWKVSRRMKHRNVSRIQKSPTGAGICPRLTGCVGLATFHISRSALLLV